MTKKSSKLEQLFIITIITVFMGQVYLTPISDWFRFSLAVLVLPLLLIHYREISIMRVSVIISVTMFVFRALIHSLTYGDLTLAETLFRYMPVIIYYPIYGALFKAFKIRNHADSERGLSMMLGLWIADSSGNIAEAIIRSFLDGLPLESAILVTILVGGVRALVTYMLYKIVVQYKNHIVTEQRERKYRELLLLTAKLKSELFFLKKSMNDIEETMTDSYALYQKLEEEEIKEQALNISKNIHEIKKDYYRVVEGMENTLSEEDTPLILNVSELFQIIRESTEKSADFKAKDIILTFEKDAEFKTDDYYPLISILNNLITNAVDAIEKRGIINVAVTGDENGENYVFTVFDNGTGIDIEDQKLIFKPGYSTKLNKGTGKLSTGIGLAHVSGMIKEYYGGTIEVESYVYESTKFTFTIPLNRLMNEEEN